MSTGMENLLQSILDLVKAKNVRVSEHGYERACEENIFVKDILASIEEATIVEEYPDYPKGPCILLLQKDQNGEPIHVVWGIPKGQHAPAVIVTAYRPDPQKWNDDFLTRRKQ